MVTFNTTQMAVAFILGACAGALVLYILLTGTVLSQFNIIVNLTRVHLRDMARRLDERTLERKVTELEKRLEQILKLADGNDD